jgi:putative transposase
MSVLDEGSHSEIFDDQKAKPRKPEQIVKLLQEGQAILATGKSEAEVLQRIEITEST